MLGKTKWYQCETKRSFSVDNIVVVVVLVVNIVIVFVFLWTLSTSFSLLDSFAHICQQFLCLFFYVIICINYTVFFFCVIRRFVFHIKYISQGPRAHTYPHDTKQLFVFYSKWHFFSVRERIQYYYTLNTI